MARIVASKLKERLSLEQIVGTVSISERPASVEDRAVPGHWEGDLISGTHNTHIATLVERHTRYVMLAKISGKESKTVINALIKQASYSVSQPHPEEPLRAIEFIGI